MSDLPLLELRGVTKRFSTVVANDNVSLSLTRGEILGILGENGAGKTTLMNILSGLFPPDDGEIIIDGIPTCFAAPRDAVGHPVFSRRSAGFSRQPLASSAG